MHRRLHALRRLSRLRGLLGRIFGLLAAAADDHHDDDAVADTADAGKREGDDLLGDSVPLCGGGVYCRSVSVRLYPGLPGWLGRSQLYK